MSPEEWKQVRDLFSRALEYEREKRAAFLSEACGSESPVRAEVERLLDQHEKATGFIEHSPYLTSGAGESPDSSGQEFLGKTLSHYEIIDVLGSGGMGVVYRARDLQLDRTIALKLLPRDVDVDAERQKQLQREARAASALNHPNIITIYETGIAEGRRFIAMELVKGETLDRLMVRRRLSVAEVLKFGSQIAEALASAHLSGIVHLDLKPSNVMVREDGWIKVVDFGLARRRPPLSAPARTWSAKEISHTAEGGVFGTVSYMSPEQAEGKSLDARSDIFSLCVVLYEMIAGQRPFRGDTIMGTLAAIISQDAKPLRELVENVPAELDQVLRTGFEKDPTRRFQAMTDLKAALDRVRDAAGFDTKQEIPRPLRVLTRRGFQWAALGVILLLAAVATLWNRSGSEPPPAPLREVRLTINAGTHIGPSLSPDGTQVAYAWNGKLEDNFDIYLKSTGTGDSLQLTSDPAADLWPEISPDGEKIAFLHIEQGNRAALMVIDIFGGRERKIADLNTLFSYPLRWVVTTIGPVLSWSPDGKHIAISQNDGDRGPHAIFIVSVDTGVTRRLTNPPITIRPGDLEVAFAPEGTSLVFTRYWSPIQPQMFRQNLTPDLSADGDPQPIETGIPGSHSPSWTGDGSILFSSGWLHNLGIWLVDASGRGTTRQIPTYGLAAFWPRSHAGRNRLVYVKAERETSTWQVTVKSPGQLDNNATRMLEHIGSGSSLEYQPNGNRVAFLSNRGGDVELWVSNSDGSGAVTLVRASEHVLAGPEWSPEGDRILYSANDSGEIHLYTIGPDGGPRRRLTSGQTYPTHPRWAPNGQSVYFGSTRSGQPEIWRLDLDGGEPVQVTTTEASQARVSPDGLLLYYMKGAASIGLWKMPVAGGAEEQLFILPQGTLLQDFAVTETGIYFATNAEAPASPLRARATAAIQYFDFSSGARREVHRPDRPVFASLAFSSDGRHLAYSQLDRDNTSVVLVEGFK